MGYRRHARRASNPDFPIARRIASFRVCITRFCRLARLPRLDVWARYRREFNLSSPGELTTAVVALEAERDCWLGRHELFAAWKHRRRQCSPPPEVAGPLYGHDGDARPSPPREPAVYVVWLYRQGLPGIGCRLVKQPPAHRAMLQNHAPWQPCQVRGPFFGREVIAYLGATNKTRQRPAEEFLRSTAVEIEL